MNEYYTRGPYHSRNETANLLRKMADNLEEVDEGNFFDAWFKIIRRMEQHNPGMRDAHIGKSMMEVVLDELDRLYAIERLVKKSLNKTKNAG